MVRGDYEMVMRMRGDDWADVVQQGVEAYRRKRSGKEPRVVVVSHEAYRDFPAIEGLTVRIGPVLSHCALVGRDES